MEDKMNKVSRANICKLLICIPIILGFIVLLFSTSDYYVFAQGSESTVTVTLAGEPLPDYRVCALTAEGAWVAGKYTDDAGQVSFLLDPGEYKFDVWYDGVKFLSEVITAPGVASIDIPAETIVTVTLGGDPLPGCRVYVYTSDGAWVSYPAEYTDDAGQVSFILEPGDYKFKVWYNGEDFWSPVITAPGATIIRIGGEEDSVPPEISIRYPLDGSTIGTDTPTISLTYSDDDSGIDVSSFMATINGENSTDLFSTDSSGATCQIEDPLPQGQNVINTSISDESGNTGSAPSTFNVSISTEPPVYFFTIPGSDGIFQSPGDGTYTQFCSGADVDAAGSQVNALYVTNDQTVYFSLAGDDAIYQSARDGSRSLFIDHTGLGVADDSDVEGVFISGSNIYFSLAGEMGINQSPGDGTYAQYLTDENLGITGNSVDGLHIANNGTILFSYEDGSGVFQSTGGGTNSQFLTDTALGVPGYVIDAFARFPDETPPAITITTPADGALINTTTPNITISFSDTDSGINLNSFMARINGTDSTSLFTVTATGASYQVTTDLPVGDNTVFASISDNVGNIASATSNFRIGILRAIPSATPTSGPAPLTVHFTTNGEDPAGTIEIFRWDWEPDGAWDTYATVATDYTHTYNTPGTYNPTLLVRSSTGEEATASIEIIVENNPPVATADVVPSNGEVPLTVNLYGSGSDPDGYITLYEWDFEGDGTFDWSSTTTGNTTYTYTTIGTHQAVFRVTDDTGLTDTAVAVTTVVRVGPPGSPTATASANPTSGDAPLAVNFTGTATDPDNDIVLYEWDFDNDGVYDFSSATSGSTSHTYNTAGTNIATFRVTDATNLTGIDQALIVVGIDVSLSVSINTVGFIEEDINFINYTQLAGVTVNASSTYPYYNYYVPGNAIDGNSETYWISAPGDTPNQGADTFIEVTFPSPQVVSQINVKGGSSYYVYYGITRARIDLFDSSDNLLYSVEVELPSSNEEIMIPDIEEVIKCRLTVLDANTYGNFCSLDELEIGRVPTPEEPTEPTGTDINTSISAATNVTIIIEDEDGNIVRTLVNEARDLGSYSDYWDCKDDNGFLVNDGLYYVIMNYQYDGEWHALDLTDTTGGTRNHFPIGSGCNQREDFTGGSGIVNFYPFDDDFLAMKFRLCSAQEVTAFIGPLWSGSDPTRIRTIINRKAYPAGSHIMYWDGLDDQGNIAEEPSGDSLITGFWRYTLPDNAIYMTGESPEVNNIEAEPNYFSPFSEKCDENGMDEGILVTYDLSEDVSQVELRVYSIATGQLVRSDVRYAGVSSGENAIFWDGKNNNGEYVDIGDYQIGLIATDADGNESMLVYTLIRIDY